MIDEYYTPCGYPCDDYEDYNNMVSDICPCDTCGDAP